jgi:hypothetical protein
LPFSVPRYIAAPSGENSRDVNGTFMSIVLNSLSLSVSVRLELNQARSTHPLSLSKSASPSVPSEHAAATRVLLNGLHDTATTSPDAIKEIVFIGLDGFVVS